MTTANTSKFDRQERLFGKEGQDRIQKTRVAIVGLGGTGSHVAQQLAYLGVREFTLIDHDRVEVSNLNRLVGASADSTNRLKAEVAADMIKSILPSSNVRQIDLDIREVKNDHVLATVDYIFGCVDNDAARLSLLQICSVNRVSYIDLATEVYPPDGILGGRIFFSEGGNGCLMCARLLDQGEIRRLNATEADLEFDEKIYGVSAENLRGIGPAVVSINGVVASIAVTEFMNATTGIMAPKMFTKIQRRRNFGIWTTDHNVTIVPDCYYCSQFSDKSDKTYVS